MNGALDQHSNFSIGWETNKNKNLTEFFHFGVKDLPVPDKLAKYLNKL